jgi:peptide-methionine (S)-S-oxide reductase
MFNRMMDKKTMVSAADALAGRSTSIAVPAEHYVNHHAMLNDAGDIAVPEGYKKALFGLGCFWGAERKFWQLDGVYLTAVGYAAGYTPNPGYEEVCSGATGHNEVVIVVFDPAVISYADLLKVFWESHNPTQGMQQGNDSGTQYRSGIYCFDDQLNIAEASKQVYNQALSDGGYREITTEIIAAPVFYFAESYHQQYLAKNPGGYCGLGGTNVCYPE